MDYYFKKIYTLQNKSNKHRQTRLNKEVDIKQLHELVVDIQHVLSITEQSQEFMNAKLGEAEMEQAWNTVTTDYEELLGLLDNRTHYAAFAGLQKTRDNSHIF